MDPDVEKKRNLMADFYAFLTRDNRWALAKMKDPYFDLEFTDSDLFGTAVHNNNEEIALKLLENYPDEFGDMEELQSAIKNNMTILVPKLLKHIKKSDETKINAMVKRNGGRRPFFISTVIHGCLLTQPGEAQTAVVPDGMTFTTITATHPGKLNYGESFDQTRRLAKIGRYLAKNKDSIKNITDVITNAHILSDMIKPEETEPYRQIGPDTFERADYLQTMDQPRIMTYQSGELFANKLFAGNVEDTHNKILLIEYLRNKPKEALNGLFDATVAICNFEEGKFTTTTIDMLNYFKSKGIRDIVLFDFSCSVFSDDDIRTPHQIRYKQFDIMNKGLAGGHTLKAKKKK